MDYFFAQAEEKRRPEIAGKVVLVCVFSGRTSDSGVISTVNYRGRALGIKSGMPIINAKKLAYGVDAIFLPVDHEYYGDISSKIDMMIRKKCSRVVQMSVDEWNIEEDDATAEEKALSIKAEIVMRFGLSSSVGIAPSLLGAKMAAGKGKPNGFVVLTKTSEKKMIDESDVEKIPGIGGKSTKVLEEIGVKKVKDLAGSDPVQLIEVFGKKGGAWLVALGKGEYNEKLGEEKEQEGISRIRTLKEMTRDEREILSKLFELETEAKEHLALIKKAYRTLSIIFITEDMGTHTKSMTFRNPKTWNEEIRKEEKELVAKFLEENGLQIRRIGIRFGGFMDFASQTTLF